MCCSLPEGSQRQTERQRDRERYRRWLDYFRHLASRHTARQESLRTFHSRCEVGCGGGCLGGVRVQSGSPDSAFVTQKRSYPVPCVSLAQHGLAIWQKGRTQRLIMDNTCRDSSRQVSTEAEVQQIGANMIYKKLFFIKRSRYRDSRAWDR